MPSTQRGNVYATLNGVHEDSEAGLGELVYAPRL